MCENQRNQEIQEIVDSFYNIIKKIEAHVNYPIKIVAFDFDCTLIPFHTTGCYTIHNSDGTINSDIMKQFFPYPELLTGFIYGLMKKGIKPAITSHSDQRFNSLNVQGLLGGSNLIIPLLCELFQRNDIFNENNVVAFSNPYDGTFTNKNSHIKQLVQNLNKQNKANQYQIQNVLLIDDTFNNIKCADSFQSIFSNFKGSSLSFGCNIDMIKIYIQMLNNQVDVQIRENYGFTPKAIINNITTIEYIAENGNNRDKGIKAENDNNEENTNNTNNGSLLILMSGIMLVLAVTQIMIDGKNNLN